jgi:hypothetical protein
MAPPVSAGTISISRKVVFPHLVSQHFSDPGHDMQNCPARENCPDHPMRPCIAAASLCPQTLHLRFEADSLSALYIIIGVAKSGKFLYRNTKYFAVSSYAAFHNHALGEKEVSILNLETTIPRIIL